MSFSLWHKTTIEGVSLETIPHHKWPPKMWGVDITNEDNVRSIRSTDVEYLYEFVSGRIPLNEAFSWSQTSQGRQFWYHIYSELDEEYEDAYIEDLQDRYPEEYKWVMEIYEHVLRIRGDVSLILQELDQDGIF